VLVFHDAGAPDSFRHPARCTRGRGLWCGGRNPSPHHDSGNGWRHANEDVQIRACRPSRARSSTARGIDYLREPDRYRDLDAHVFDRLAAIVASGNRNVAAIEQSRILDRAQFFSRLVEDHVSSRSLNKVVPR
jgi:hypothetical protein